MKKKIFKSIFTSSVVTVLITILYFKKYHFIQFIYLYFDSVDLIKYLIFVAWSITFLKTGLLILENKSGKLRIITYMGISAFFTFLICILNNVFHMISDYYVLPFSLSVQGINQWYFGLVQKDIFYTLNYGGLRYPGLFFGMMILLFCTRFVKDKINNF